MKDGISSRSAGASAAIVSPDPLDHAAADPGAGAAMFQLHATAVGTEWRLPVTRGMCVGAEDRPFMFGGIGLGAALVAAERSCGRPVAWAAAQFYAHAAPGQTVDLRIRFPAAGTSSTQARIIASVGGVDIYSVGAALGARDHPVSAQWVRAPTVPAPDMLADTFAWPSTGAALRKRLEVRPAPVGEAGAPGGSRRVLWMRARDGLPLDVGLLSIYADFVSIGIETALGAPWKGSSLDNTIRVRRIMPADWVLCDIAIQGVHAGIAHGDMRIFTPDGELIAVASQSMIVRRYD